MRSSWGCCWLVLAWALLLGHPASGQEEEYQVAPLEEPDDPVEVGWLEEPEDRLEPEEAVMENESEEPEDLLEPEDEELEESSELLEPEDVEEPEDEEEQLEDIARSYRRDMQREKFLGYYKDLALDYMELNKHGNADPYAYLNADPNAVYRHMEDSSITVQKAFGNIIKFRMFLTKGHCVDERVAANSYHDYIVTNHYWDPIICQNVDCVFTVFHDVRNHHEAVINSECRPLLNGYYMAYQRHNGDLVTPYDDYTDYHGSGDDTWGDEPVSDEVMPDVPTSDEDTFEVPISDDDAPYAPTSSVDTPDSDGDTPDVPTADDDDDDAN